MNEVLRKKCNERVNWTGRGNLPLDAIFANDKPSVRMIPKSSCSSIRPNNRARLYNVEEHALQASSPNFLAEAEGWNTALKARCDGTMQQHLILVH